MTITKVNGYVCWLQKANIHDSKSLRKLTEISLLKTFKYLNTILIHKQLNK